LTGSAVHLPLLAAARFSVPGRGSLAALLLDGYNDAIVVRVACRELREVLGW